ncbi:3-methyl-2-oxobutanoate hydroxymethyltransferase [Alicyclobacillus fodiniaquatilis]|uniref:3-methyl-2-oxobutanoate hydroxymethyltransferase n=1 Tax=Alicyclobacillus fodiniaquatilis TaxID=1661150 RepID=A0ABW4JDY1_9BACL
MPNSKPTIHDFRAMKAQNKNIVMVTAYDYPAAKAVAAAGVDIILVGDSLGMAVLGYDSTIPVTMDDMIHHAKATRRGAPNSFIVTDLPFLSYQVSVAQALRNAARLVQEGWCDAVKLEGGRNIADQVHAIVEAGIPVMGHIGLQPQSVNQLGGYKVQGRTYEDARSIIEEAKILEQAGCFALVVECVNADVADIIATQLTIPVIGIGAGKDCDGQVLVLHDLLGMHDGRLPKFVKTYGNVLDEMVQGVSAYAAEVRATTFPAAEHTYSISVDVRDRLRKEFQPDGHH